MKACVDNGLSAKILSRKMHDYQLQEILNILPAHSPLKHQILVPTRRTPVKGAVKFDPFGSKQNFIYLRRGVLPKFYE